MGDNLRSNILARTLVAAAVATTCAVAQAGGAVAAVPVSTTYVVALAKKQNPALSRADVREIEQLFGIVGRGLLGVLGLGTCWELYRSLTS